MRLEERSYSGKIFRPRPEVHIEDSGSLCIIATPWGARAAAKKVIQSIQDFFLSARNDGEATSPFQTLASLSPAANTLRVAIMLANDTIYREDNKDEYHSGVEVLVIARQQSECVWAQIGSPQVLLDRIGLDITTLGTSGDLALQHSDRERILAPLPQNLLGTAATSNFSVHSLYTKPDDRLILLSRSLTPPRMLALPREERTLSLISKVLSHQSADLPFWLGILNL